MSTDRPKFTLNLNETNSLGFALTIEGSSSDVDSKNPIFRFVLAERGGEKAWLYPMQRDDEGDIVVAIPSETHFLENKTYQGQVEVLLGNHYFVPTTVDIEFIKPLKVEAVAKVKSSNSNNLIEESNQPIRVSSVTAKAKNKVTKEMVTESVQKPMDLQPAKQKKTWNDLSKEEQKKLVEHLRAKKMNELRKAKEVEAKKKNLQERKIKEAETTIKDQLKSLLSDSLIEEE